MSYSVRLSLTSLSMMSSGLTYVVTNGRISFFLVAGSCSTGCMCVNGWPILLSIPPLTDRHHALATVFTSARVRKERRISQVLTRFTDSHAHVPSVLGVQRGEGELAAKAPALRPPLSAGTVPSAVLGHA